jgi:hypothetical protein
MNTKQGIPIQLLMNVPKGEWAAISHDQERLVAHSVELQEALRKAHADGEKDPYMTRVPSRP